MVEQRDYQSHEKRADIVYRFNLEKANYDAMVNPKKFIKTALINDTAPANIKTTINKADKAFSDLLKTNKVCTLHDFEDGVYFSIPKDARGAEMIKMKRDRFSQDQYRD